MCFRSTRGPGATRCSRRRRTGASAPCSVRAPEEASGGSPMTTSQRGTGLGSDRLLSTRRALVSLAAGVVAGVLVRLLATPRLLPLVTWTVTVAVLLTWVWRVSWPQDA